MTATDDILEVNDATFDHEVLGSELPVLVDFGAAWCPPCRALAPTLARLAAETKGRVKVVTVDTEVSPLTAARYDVRAVPTLLVFRGGGQTIRHLGVASKQKLLDLIGV